jgi:hypothetical protein
MHEIGLNKLYKECPPKTPPEDAVFDAEHYQINDDYKRDIQFCKDQADAFPYTNPPVTPFGG